ncbi:acyl carrier protein [Collimonas pratensis]|uniref:Phosphopantetheine attachment site family protein n=1 Tax=Collimonas pratensis TaxID=279113 RepID=A0A127Q5L8_9BURK|nr:acyl carrier protein [Collimonas pratensis]AMP05327.1 phosphopantetheine attachment site family protein [Collimonas pratensis]
MKQDLTLDEIKAQIASLVGEYMGINPELVLSGKNFDTLIEQFDSLAMVEIQLLVEKHYGFDLDFEDVDKNAFPANISELAEAFLMQYIRYHKKIESKQVKLEATNLSTTVARDTEQESANVQEADLQKSKLSK